MFAIIAAASLLAVAPAVDKDKASGGDSTWNENKKMLQQEGQNREPGPNGTFQGKPVVAGPADWHSKLGSASDSDASAGASSGEGGASSRSSD
jgi:hypothetical protein